MAKANTKTQGTEDKAAGTEVAVKPETGGVVATTNMMDQLASMGQEFAETMTRDDMSIPFLSILQPLSPQVVKGEAEYVKGAEASMIFDTVSKELFATRDEDDKAIPAPFHVVSVHYKDSYIEWVPRNQGGGFVDEYDAAEGARIITHRNDNNQDIISNDSPFGTPGNQLAYTHTHFLFMVTEDGRILPFIASMASTQVRPSRDWNALISRKALPNGAKAPRFFGRWQVTTTRRTNEQGSWYVWHFLDDGSILDFGEDLAKRIMEEAATLRRGIDAGDIEVDHSKAANEPINKNGSGNAQTTDGNDEEIPF